MIIKDINRNYELRVDKTRRIVYEKIRGSWEAETYRSYDYRTKVIEYLGAGDWMKFSDLRKNKPNVKVTPEMINEHLLYLKDTGFKGGAVLVDSTTLKMQLIRASRSVLEPKYFDNEAEADEWLKSLGF